MLIWIVDHCKNNHLHVCRSFLLKGICRNKACDLPHLRVWDESLVQLQAEVVPISNESRQAEEIQDVPYVNSTNQTVYEETSVDTGLFTKVPQSSRENKFICFCNKPEGTCNYKYCKFAHSEKEFRFTPDVELLYNIIKNPKKYFDFLKFVEQS